MLKFPDNRWRFKHAFQGDFSAQPNPENKTKLEPKTDLAKRAERTSFRLTTTEDPVLLQKMAEDEALAAQAKASEPDTQTADAPAQQDNDSEESGIPYEL